MTQEKPREFYVELGGDPSNDKEMYKRYCASIPFETSPGLDVEVVRFIEFGAYEDALAAASIHADEHRKLRDLVEKLAEAIEAAMVESSWPLVKGILAKALAEYQGEKKWT